MRSKKSAMAYSNSIPVWLKVKLVIVGVWLSLVLVRHLITGRRRVAIVAASAPETCDILDMVCT